MANQNEAGKKISWYQNKIVAVSSLISSLVFLCGLIVSIMWYGRVTNQISEDVTWLKECQMKQIELNSKYNTIIELGHEKD